MRSYQYDVALSYAGEDRDYVTAVAKHLKNAQVKLYFDNFETASMWGKNLILHLSRIYRDEARYFVPFVSKHYVRKPWPRREADAAFARALNESEYILPVRFDETELPGLELTTAWIDAQVLRPVDLAELIITKINSGFSSADIAAFYDLWHASVPTKGMVERLQERLERSSVTGSRESQICQARLSVALAEQYTKTRDSVKAKAAIARALTLVDKHSRDAPQGEELQILFDCKWLSLIVRRFEDKPLLCVQECQTELAMVKKKLSKRLSRRLRSQYLFHRIRIERSLITYYQLANFIPESLALAKKLETEQWPYLDSDLLSDALSEAHILPVATMRRLLVYEKFQTARRIFSAYVYVGDHRSALRFLPEFLSAFGILVKVGAMDTISMVVFNRLCGNCAGLLALDDSSKSGKELRAIAAQALTLSRLSALQQELPASYLQEGVLERTLVPTIDLENTRIPSRTKDGQAAYLRRLKRAFGKVRLHERIGITLVYRKNLSHASASVALLSSDGGRTVVAAHSPQEGAGAYLKRLCESLLLAFGESLREFPRNDEIEAHLKRMNGKAKAKSEPTLSVFFAHWEPRTRRLNGFLRGNAVLTQTRRQVVGCKDEIKTFDFVVGRSKTNLHLGSCPGERLKHMPLAGKRVQYERFDVW